MDLDFLINFLLKSLWEIPCQKFLFEKIIHGKNRISGFQQKWNYLMASCPEKWLREVWIQFKRRKIFDRKISLFRISFFDWKMIKIDLLRHRKIRNLVIWNEKKKFPLIRIKVPQIINTWNFSTKKLNDKFFHFSKNFFWQNKSSKRDLKGYDLSSFFLLSPSSKIKM